MAKLKTSKNQRTELSRGFVGRLLAPLELTERQEVSSRETRTAILILSVLIVLLLLPFMNRAFHVDDPLFIWAAKHIQTNPADPYAFKVNWYGADMPMSEVTKNPPLASYYIAAAASVLGWSEPALHFAFLLPALVVAIGTFLIARRFCKRPLLAALAGVLTPVFILSSLTVMSDVLMLAFWVLAVHFWIKGLESKSHTALALAGFLIGLSALSKYFGMTLIPLLLLYSITKERRVGWWLLYFLIPAVILAWYQWKTQQLYGRGLLLDAAAYATGTETQFGKFSIPKTFVNLTFTGGCIASVLFFAGQLWARKIIITGIILAAIGAYVISSLKSIGEFPMPATGSARWLLSAQLALWFMAGASLLALAVIDLYRHRDAGSLFLFFWIIGTFVFAGFINWTTNGRSILPMIVPAGILIARGIEDRVRPKKHARLRYITLPLLASTVVSLAVTWADGKFADTARAGAVEIHERYKHANTTIWFLGHWGFQYYMEQLGARPVDVTASTFARGDIIAAPTTNTNVYALPREWSRFREAIEIPSSYWLATMNQYIGAGFYADVWGPLPFAVGTVALERFNIFDVDPQSSSK